MIIRKYVKELDDEYYIKQGFRREGSIFEVSITS